MHDQNEAETQTVLPKPLQNRTDKDKRLERIIEVILADPGQSPKKEEPHSATSLKQGSSD